MRKQMLIAGGVVLLLLIFVFSAVKLLRKTPQTVCGKFISNVQKDNADASYALFDTNTKSNTDQSDWANKVKGFSTAYGSATVKYVDQNSSTSQTNTTPTYTLNYTLTKSNKTVYNVTCSVISNQVDGYSSQLQLTQ